MNYKKLGRSNLQVSEACLGAMTFGKETNEADSHSIMGLFRLSYGYRLNLPQ